MCFCDGVLVAYFLDDLLEMEEDNIKMSELKIKLDYHLSANDVGIAVEFLGMSIIHQEGPFTIVQSNYVQAFVEKLALINCNETLITCDPNVVLIIPSEEVTEEYFSTVE